MPKGCTNIGTILDAWTQAGGLPDLVPEYRFHPKRKWRFDFAWPASRIAVEINGGVWVQGRHNRGKGYLADLEKMNAAQAAGWRVGQFTPQQTAEMVAWLEEVFGDY
jgi:hypothetical protein